MRFFLSLISALQLLRYANEGLLTGSRGVVHAKENKNGRERIKIGIIGAGFAGLSAYHRAVELGFSNVHLFEASHRVGGRVYPLPFDGIYLQQGAEFINGRDNPIYDMAVQFGLIVDEVNDAALISDETLYASESGCEVPPDKIAKFTDFVANLELRYAQMASTGNRQQWSRTIGQLFASDYANFLQEVEANMTTADNGKVKEQYDSLAQMYRAYYEGEWSAPIERLALHNYAQWKDGGHAQSFGSFGSFTLDARGYAPILDALARHIPPNRLHLGARVVNIDYREPQIRLLVQAGDTPDQIKQWSSTFDFIIVTLPIGHLKRFSPVLFTPPLPSAKLDAIRAIGFGAMQKLHLVYDRAFWPENMSSLVALGCQNGEKQKKKTDRILENLHTFQPHPWRPNQILVAWLSGNGPKLVNELDDEELADLLTEHFRELLPERREQIGRPKKIIRTKWLDDELYLGSYTYITPEASRLSADPFEQLAAPIWGPDGAPKVMFAGEGTHSRMYQTTIGAMQSGRREAERLAEYWAGKEEQMDREGQTKKGEEAEEGGQEGNDI